MTGLLIFEFGTKLMSKVKLKGFDGVFEARIVVCVNSRHIIGI